MPFIPESIGSSPKNTQQVPLLPPFVLVAFKFISKLPEHPEFVTVVLVILDVPCKFTSHCVPDVDWILLDVPETVNVPSILKVLEAVKISVLLFLFSGTVGD